MKNLLIAILSTYIFYTQFCQVKIIGIMPVFAALIWIVLSDIDCFIEEYRESVRRGKKLQRKIKRIGGVE